MDQPPDSLIWDLLRDYIWAPASGLFVLLAKGMHTNLNDKIKDAKAVADAAVPQRAFDKHLDDQREYRQQREKIDTKLFDKIDDLKDLIIERTGK